MEDFRNMTEEEILQRVSDIKNMTEEELLQRAKELLIKYEFSHYALYDNRIPLGIDVPKELEEQWKKEYYEKMVESFDLSGEIEVLKIENILLYGLVNNNFSLLNKFYEVLKNYSNIDVVKKKQIIDSIRLLSDKVKNQKNKLLDIERALCQTPEQAEYVKRIFDLAEEIYKTIDKDKSKIPSDVYIIGYPSKTEEERKEMFIDGLEWNILRLRENRKIIGF